MKYIQLFENFKKKNISIDDVIECIRRGGVIYADIVNGYSENNPEIPMVPQSVDENGTVTVSIDSHNYEVELRNIKQIEWM